MANSFPRGQAFDMTTGKVFFAGVDFDWALDMSGWSNTWDGVTTYGGVVIDLTNMQIKEVIVGDFNEQTVQTAIDPYLEVPEG